MAPKSEFFSLVSFNTVAIAITGLLTVHVIFYIFSCYIYKMNVNIKFLLEMGNVYIHAFLNIFELQCIRRYKKTQRGVVEITWFLRVQTHFERSRVT